MSHLLQKWQKEAKKRLNYTNIGFVIIMNRLHASESCAVNVRNSGPQVGTEVSAHSGTKKNIDDIDESL